MALMAEARGTVLIGFADALAAPEAAWSLVAAGWRVIAFSRVGSKPAVRLDKRIEIVDVPAPERDFSGCLIGVQGVAERSGPVAVLPLDDAALLLCGRLAEEKWAKNAGPVLAGPVGDQLRFVLDKREQMSAAARAGLHVPPDVRVARNDSRFPVIVRPALAADVYENSLVSGHTIVCSSAKELDGALAGARAPVIVQSCLEGVGEGLFCLVTADGPHAWSAHRRVRMMNPSGSGASACSPIPVDDAASVAAEKLLMGIGWRGIAMIELLRDTSGRAWFMEVNGRTWGSTSLARIQGLEYPAWSVDEALGIPFGNDSATMGPVPADLVVRHAGRELVHLLAVLRGPRSETPQPWPARSSALRDTLRIRRSDRWYNQHPGLRRLFVDDTVRTVVDQLKSRSRRR
jgi:hypothetical protein